MNSTSVDMDVLGVGGNMAESGGNDVRVGRAGSVLQWLCQPFLRMMRYSRVQLIVAINRARSAYVLKAFHLTLSPVHHYGVKH